jgi:hypothetical protein
MRAGQQEINPYTSPLLTKPSASDAKDLQYRSILGVVLLSAVTLFIGYHLYLVYQWARELNGLAQQARHSPKLVLLISIVTLGIGAMIYECIFAEELERHFRERRRTDPRPHLMTWVIALNAITFVLSLTLVGAFLAIPCGLAATCLVQAEFNKLAGR